MNWAHSLVEIEIGKKQGAAIEIIEYAATGDFATVWLKNVYAILKNVIKTKVELQETLWWCDCMDTDRRTPSMKPTLTRWGGLSN